MSLIDRCLRLGLLSIGSLCLASASKADVLPASLFCEHAVLQQGMPIPVWGTASDGEQVTVSLGGASVSTVAQGGKWLVRLPATAPGGPFVLVIEGKNRIELRDILIGDVWICSGQSNMERQLGPRGGQKPIIGWEREAAAAHYPRFRQFSVEQRLALDEQSRAGGAWQVCTPQTVADFSAVGFFFGKALQAAHDAPIGLIHTAWGGTPAEAWMSESGIAAIPEFQEAVKRLTAVKRDPAAAKRRFDASLNEWFERNDTGSSATESWSRESLDASGWPVMNLPCFFDKEVLPNFDGVVWFQKEIFLNEEMAREPAELHLGAIDDVDSTWVNGHYVGGGTDWLKSRVYPVAPELLHSGRNVITVRVLDNGGGGGLWGGGDKLRLSTARDEHRSIILEGGWHYHSTVDLHLVPPPPADPSVSSGTPTVLYNGMIAPLEPYAIRGVIWYQGEANSGQAKLYTRLFPQLVANWRGAWGQGNFPFLFVQIAPFNGTPLEIREAQRFALNYIPNSAMVVTLDAGDALDIHPAEKKIVGDRLALAARALAYGENLEYSGPLYERSQIAGGRILLNFTHTGKGLVSPGGVLRGFTIAGKDMNFRPAKAVIVGDTVEVSRDDVPEPVAVRYAWANVPDCNLFNQDGLPASSFSTEAWP